METIDEGRLPRARWAGSRSRPGLINRSSSGTIQSRHAFRDPPHRQEPRQERARTTTATAWSRTTSRSASCSRSARTNWASPTTRSSCIPPDNTAPRTTPGGCFGAISAPRKTTSGRALAKSSAFLRWPEQDRGRVGLQRHRLSHRHVPDLAGTAAACDPDVTQKLLNGCTFEGKTAGVPSRRLQHDPFVTQGAVKESRETPSCTSATTAK